MEPIALLTLLTLGKSGQQKRKPDGPELAHAFRFETFRDCLGRKRQLAARLIETSEAVYFKERKLFPYVELDVVRLLEGVSSV